MLPPRGEPGLSQGVDDNLARSQSGEIRLGDAAVDVLPTGRTHKTEWTIKQGVVMHRHNFWR